ncbi:MAG: ElyC/SanA/YdcF family protein [Alphaproteobacteria bacterium]
MIIAVFGIAITWLCNHWVISSTKDQLFNTVESTPYRKTGLLLGTNKSWHGTENPYFKLRIDAAVALFKAGKIKHIIVSGDNHLSYYDETKDMKDSLLKQGVPDSCITLDYAGFRTLDSMVRCLEIFGQDSVTVISQAFHNERAIFIANYYKMHAVGFNAQDPPAMFSIQTKVREYLAKFKAVLDLYVFHTSPHFLGEKIKIQ